MHGGWLFHRACEKLDLAELCQPGGQKYVMFVSLYSNQALCREIRKEMVCEGETEKGIKTEDFAVHPEFQRIGLVLNSSSSVVTQLCYEEMLENAIWITFGIDEQYMKIRNH